MDGGSTDGTKALLEKYSHRLAYWQSQKDHGQADAIASGFDRATGDILAYLNSDDLLAPGALARVADYFDRHPEVDVIYSHRCFIDETNRVLGYWILPPHWGYLMKRFDYIPQETTFWRRRIFEQVGNIDPSFRFAMDYDLFVRFMNVGRMRRVNDIYGAFRLHNTSKTQTQIETIGLSEMARVRRRYRISIRKPDHLLLKMFVAGVKGSNLAWTGYRRWISGVDRSKRRNFAAWWDGRLDADDQLGTVPMRQAS
jgi:glycosyltransferase involved in cell wall biosynthesis